MKSSITVIAGAIMALSVFGTSAFGQGSDPLFGNEAAKPKPAGEVVNALTTEGMAAILNAADGLEAMSTQTDDGTKYVAAKLPNGIQFFLIPLCKDEQNCPIYRVFTPLAKGTVRGEVYLRFHSSSFGAFLDRTEDGSATLLIDGIMLAGGVRTDNVLNSVGMFLADLQRAHEALSQQTAQGDRGELHLTSGSGMRPAKSTKGSKPGAPDPAVAAYIDSLKTGFEKNLRK